MKQLLFSFVLLLTLLFSGWGCSPYWYRSPEKFAVASDRLNWVHIYYQEAENRPRIRCEMTNNGQITILEGHSVTVGDDFNIEYHKKSFGDVRKYYYSMPPEMFNMTLQSLIDAGMMEREKLKEDAPMYPKVMIKANINHVKQQKFTVNERLIDEIRTLLFQCKMSGTLTH